MLRGLYTAASGMLAQAARLDLEANNLANAGTSGYKADQAELLSFPSILLHRVGGVQGDPVPAAPGGAPIRTRPEGMDRLPFRQAPVVGPLGTGVYVEGVHTSFRQGPLHATGNPLDLALEGPGFFAVETPAGVRYTRAGGFRLDAEGYLADPAGNRVLGVDGPVAVGRGGAVTVTDEGTVFVDGQPAGQLVLVDFADPNAELRKQGANLYGPRPGAVPQPAPGARVAQGMLEGSAVNVVEGMVRLIELQRAYDASQRVVRSYDETLGQAVNELARI
ncbi:flagellar basal-body rod protein FlgF [Limnochorda pilosa]|uniref:Flagellar basal-body rod protein FlgF n=1 Tax=Limnochorda pilosa TaxID=1555112 RepID=A0A0K2SPZ4_LIMPI|nr:flagellar basal-body rod protein FlgF [Limnochorda pilosa]BAS28909.1 flagellar basal-body rod protein FlgF [Limnochorda pilosa]